MIFNYRWVSIILKSTERQLMDVPCDREFEDKLSGKNRNHSAFELIMSMLRKGDEVNVHSLDRVGRNTKDRGCPKNLYNPINVNSAEQSGGIAL